MDNTEKSNEEKLNSENITEKISSEYRNIRYEHMFKFIWFFWVMLGAGTSLFMIFDINKYDAPLCTIGPAMMSIALILLFVTAKYLIYEKDAFVVNKENCKKCDKNIMEAENLYVTSNILMRAFFTKIIPVYFGLLITGSLTKFNIYQYATEKYLPYIVLAIGVFSIILMIIESVDSIKFKGIEKEFKNKMTKIHLATLNYILIFIVLFAFFIVVQNSIFSQNIVS